ncbi:hypothetical protein C0J52_00837 [Blattella germanica]|nr:hypothetical protein C0J52_00837 [Blattella germanica]
MAVNHSTIFVVCPFLNFIPLQFTNPPFLVILFSHLREKMKTSPIQETAIIYVCYMYYGICNWFSFEQEFSGTEFQGNQYLPPPLPSPRAQATCHTCK